MATRSMQIQRQLTTTRPMELLGIDLVYYKGEHSLVTVDYFCGFITYDIVSNETSQAVMKILNNIFRKFGLPEKIISDNGPCFSSDSFRNFCEQLDIGHITSSSHYHQSNGRAERVVATVKKILKKSKSDVDITKSITAYLDTPVSDALPSPAELFHNRRINTRFGMSMRPAPLTDQQKIGLSNKRSAHLKSPKENKVSYMPNQPVWFTDDNSDEWKPGYIESKDQTPDSYWIVNTKSNRRLRRNIRVIKPRYAVITQQRPQPSTPLSEPSAWTRNYNTPLVSPTAFPEVSSPVNPLPDDSSTTTSSPSTSTSQTHCDDTLRATKQVPRSTRPTTEDNTRTVPSDHTAVASTEGCQSAMARSRFGRQIRLTKDPDFVYGISYV